MATLGERLGRGEVLILDGATGTELERRGVPMHRKAWSAAALLTHPDIVRAVHEDYIRVGADIIITNSFATARHVLEPAGLADRLPELNARSVALAQEARDHAAGGREVFIAGSISTFDAGLDSKYRPSAAQAQSNYREQAELLAEAGVDLIMLEVMHEIEKTTYAIEAAVATGLPTWVGFACCVRQADSAVALRHDDDAVPPDDYPALAAALEILMPLGGAGVNIMHTLTEDVTPAVQVVKQHWHGPVGAYAHSGHHVDLSWQFGGVISPEAYVTHAQEWVARGVQIVGGCCGTGPAHIQLLKAQLPSHIAMATP